MLSRRTKRNISRVIPFAGIWFIFSIVYCLLERGLLGNLTTYPSTGNPYNFGSNILITPITAFVTGLLIGAIEIFYLNRLFVHKKFAEKIIYKTLIYLAIIILFLWTLTIITNSAQLGKNLLDEKVWNNVWLFFTSYAFWGVGVYIAAIIVASLFYVEVSSNVGRGVLNNFFKGKYHKPIEEERIFMFLDMKSSTSIAEHLGHVKYFGMLKEYYKDLSNPIIQFYGEIYQYVGDEIVVSWNLGTGLKNDNCIQCFFDMKASLQRQQRKYHEKFGLLPQFKAGFHYGKVTTGEIGVIKKEIIFTGDVLNTAARVQALCNTYKVDILISGPLIKKLHLHSGYKIKSLGENELRGRDEKIELFTISLQ